MSKALLAVLCCMGCCYLDSWHSVSRFCTGASDGSRFQRCLTGDDAHVIFDHEGFRYVGCWLDVEIKHGSSSPCFRDVGDFLSAMLYGMAIVWEARSRSLRGDGDTR